MNTVSFAIQAAARTDRVASQWTLSVFIILVGVIVAGALIWAVRLGMSVRDREPAPPRPDEQPHLPDGGPVLEEREVREPEEVPHAGASAKAKARGRTSAGRCIERVLSRPHPHCQMPQPRRQR